jgi:hypothetical protein
MNIDIFNTTLFTTVRGLVEDKTQKELRKLRPSSTDSHESKVSYNLSSQNFSSNTKPNPGKEPRTEPNNFMSVQVTGSKKGPISADDFVKNRAPHIVDFICQKLELSNLKAGGMFLRTKNLEELQEEKMKVKKELINYDEDFKSEVGRKPAEKEKEPMKICYLYYKHLKKHIDNYGKREDNWKAEKIKEIYQKLNSLNNKKAELSGPLIRFQKNFEAANGRKIKHQSDIAPIKKEHELYKQLKYDISILYLELNKLTKNTTP